MKIASSQIAMTSLNEYKEYHSVQASLRQWNDAKVKGDRINLSAEGLALSDQLDHHVETLPKPPDLGPEASLYGPDALQKPTDEELFTDEDLKKIRLLESMLEKLFGYDFKFHRIGLKRLREAMHEASHAPLNMPSQVIVAPTEGPAQPQRVGWGIDFSMKETSLTVEKTTFSTKGLVQTEDSRQIDFSLNLHMSRETYSEFSMSYKAGDALIDPIIIRTEDLPLSFSKEPIAFDLDVDGRADQVRLPVDHAGLLFFDRNQNGIADDGSELFGPSSGKGYAELAALDDDHNGWIDEKDGAFKDLKLWIRSSDGTNRYLGLIEAGVGALFATGKRTDMTLGTTETVGKLRETGLYLKENGQVGLMHEVDLKI